MRITALNYLPTIAFTCLISYTSTYMSMHTHTPQTQHTHIRHTYYISCTSHTTPHTHTYTHTINIRWNTTHRHTHSSSKQPSNSPRISNSFVLFIYFFGPGWPGMNLCPLQWKLWSPYCWTAREFPNSSLLIPQIQVSSCFYSFCRVVWRQEPSTWATRSPWQKLAAPRLCIYFMMLMYGIW